jgi:mannosyltransferase OCH1-like enzyme
MIPKIIHYCWFGGNPLPEIAQTCIASWKKYLLDYEIILWNESNFDVNMVPFTEQVAKTKKWGFIVDYIRAYVVYHYGGIYLDTDVEIIKPFDDSMLQNKCFSGFEDDKYVNPGSIFAGEKSCHIAKELMEFYSTHNFIKEDGEPDLMPSPIIFTKILKKHGLAQNNTFQELGEFTAYPNDYFCPKSMLTGKITITGNTFSIHHYDASWLSEKARLNAERRRRIFAAFGVNPFTKTIAIFLSVSRRINEHGIRSTFKYYYSVYSNKK